MKEFLTNIFGDEESRFLKQAHATVEEINALEAEYEQLDDKDLPAKTAEFKERLAGGETLDDILPEAFAVAREAAKRTLGQRHYDEQLLGGITMHAGKIAEMKTGEGKTLAATLPVYLNALTEKGVHLVTVNDYLARRDTVWMGQIYAALGLSVACITHDTSYVYDESVVAEKENKDAQETEEDKERDILGGFKVEHDFLRPVERKEAYRADITYGTNNQFGFDYLRDNLAHSTTQLSQRSKEEGGWHFTIVDEIDSILIDEARTPLIISRPDEESGKLYQKFAKLAPRLNREEHYTIDEKKRAVSLTQEGISKMEEMLGVDNLYQESDIKTIHHMDQALKAQALFKKDRDYVVKDGEVVIIDQFTGRMMPGRRYSQGLHQALEAKEGVAIQRESRTVATITFQNYFRRYEKLAGMTGTAKSSEEEFFKVYGLGVVQIPTHKPLVRKALPDKVYRTERGKFKAVARQIKKLHEDGQPVLVGTISIEKNEQVSALLKHIGIPHKVLNAKNHEGEAEIVAQAGKKGAVTVATNLAGRGVDIVLGGNPQDPQEAEEVKEAGGLFVLGTERHEARRIDNQLRGRAGRQGDPGASQFFVSLEDDLMRVFGGDKVKNMMERLNIPEDESIQSGIVSKAIESAQGRIEGYHFDARKHVLEYDEVINRQRETIYTLRRSFIQPNAQETIRAEVRDVLEDEVRRTINRHVNEDIGTLNTDAIAEEIRRIIPMNDEDAELFKKRIAEEDAETLRNDLTTLVLQAHQEKEEKLGEATMRQLEKTVFLQVMDELWMDHLEQMDYIKTSIGLRAVGQRDPLVEYKKEAHRLFQTLQAELQTQVARLALRVGVAVAQREPETPQNLQFSGPKKQAEEQGGGGITAGAGAKGAAPRRPKTTGGEKIGRNDPCPCGSGKKWKKCGRLKTKEHLRRVSQ